MLIPMFIPTVQTLIVRTGEPPLNDMSLQVIRIGATDVTVALVQRVLYAYLDKCDIGCTK